MKSFLFILRHPPQPGPAGLETLDMIMTIAAFDQSVRVLFLDDGVFLLKPDQHPYNPDLKPTAPLLAALEIYDVEGLWAEEESLSERGLALSDLIVPMRTLRRAEIAFFMSAADMVVAC